MNQNVKICPKCGTAVEPGEYFCPSCRHECPDKPERAEEPANPVSSLICGGLAILIVLGFFGGLAILIWDDTNSRVNNKRSVVSIENCSKVLTCLTSWIPVPEIFKGGVPKPFRTKKTPAPDNSSASAFAKAAENSRRRLESNGSAREVFNQGAVYHARGNYAKALEYWQSAASLGDAEAMYNIGSYYYNGIGVNQNDNEAYRWFMMSASAGYAQAQFAIGGMYITGAGTSQNIEEGKRWFRLAAGQGHQQAAAELNKLESSGSQYY